MARPTLKVEFAFDAGVSGTPTWTDVTALRHVRVNPGIEANHWRRDEGSTCEPSRCSLTLRNDDGRYTPGNASSPHSPNIKKGRRLRVTSTLNGEDFPRFTGYVDDWRAEWPAVVGHISDCRVTASSRMAYLGRGAELRSIAEECTLMGSPDFLYTLSEPTESSTAADSSGNAAPTLTQRGSGAAVTFGTAAGAPTDGLTAAAFAANPARWLEGTGVTMPRTLSCWFSTTGSDAEFLTVTATDGTTARLGMAGGGTGKVSATFSIAGGGTVFVRTNATFNDGEDHHAAVVFTSAGTSSAVLYIDGVAVALDTNLTAGSTLPQPTGCKVSLGAHITTRSAFTLAHAAGHPTSLTADDIGLMSTAGHTGFAGATPAGMIALYAALAGVDTTDLDTGRVPALAHIDTTGMTALAAMRAVEETEGGVLFDALDGTLTFHDRARRYEAAAFGTLLFGGVPFGGGPHGTEFTLSVAQGHVASAPFPVLDDQRQVNDMSNTNANGVTGRSKDQASIDDHGLYRDAKTLHTTDPDEPLLRASWTVNRYAEPLTRVSEVEVDIHALPDDLAALVLSAQVGTIFTLADLPDNAPSSTMHLFVEGRTDRITADEDRVILRTSPVEVYEVFRLDDPDRGLDSGYPLAY